MRDASGEIVKVATPGMAVTLSGWKELPSAGDEVLTADESDIRKALANRQRRAEQRELIVDAVAINTQRQLDRDRKIEEANAARHFKKTGMQLTVEKEEEVDATKELNIVLKGDVSGSVEAVQGAIEGIGNHLAKVKVISTGVGEVTESDVNMARVAKGDH
jgi:translation initiation factor IF-2